MNRTFFTLLLPLASLLGSTTVFAGKAERDAQAQLKPKVAEQEKALKAACGCDIPIVVQWESYKSAGDMNVVSVMARNLVDAAKEQCNSPDNKKALCDNVKTVKIVFTRPVVDPVLKDKTLEVHSAEGEANSDGQITEIIKKL